MVPLLLLAGITLEPIALDEPILAARVVDVDADGREDVVAVSAKHLYLFPRAKGPAHKRPAPRLTVLGRGLLAVVRDGRLHRVRDPFGKWDESDAGPASLLGALGKGEPALLDSPGDVDGDGRADPVLCGPRGFHTPAGLVPIVPEARLDIYRNEAFAVEYRIPVPVAGSWSGRGRELAFFHDGDVIAFRGTKETERIPLPLAATAKEARAMRRNEVFLRDIDGDGRLDLLIVIAKGRTELFAKFEATVRLFPGGRIYNHERKLFYRPASFLKVAGLLLESSLVDLDRDGDLDLVLATIDMSLLAGATGVATGSAPGTYYLFHMAGDGYQRKPAWTFKNPVPLDVFTEKPEPPVRFLPDLDGDGRPEAVVVGNVVRVLEPDGDGTFQQGPEARVDGAKKVAIGRTLAVVPHEKGLLLVEAGS